MDVDIYQTLEDKGNYKEIELHGPYYCSIYEEDGSIKKGTKEPWMGEGYYFWDTRKDDAYWWGETIYFSQYKGFVICHTTYDTCSPLLFDLVGNISHIDEFEKCALYIMRKEKKRRVSFPYVLAIMKSTENFNFKAVRACPSTRVDEHSTHNKVIFPGNKAFMKATKKVQICFFDKTLLKSSFKIHKICPFPNNFTI